MCIDQLLCVPVFNLVYVGKRRVKDRCACACARARVCVCLWKYGCLLSDIEVCSCLDLQMLNRVLVGVLQPGRKQ